MNAYFDLIKSMMWLFIVISIFSIPAMMVYQKYGAIKEMPKGAITQFSLGNMGTTSPISLI